MQPSSSLLAKRDKDEIVKIDWDNLAYNVLIKDGPRSSLFKSTYVNKAILQGLSGTAQSGQLLAILGPTGSGKTTLLNVLAARLQDSGKNSLMALTGSITVNGTKREEVWFRTISAYVSQDDYLYPHLTVFETLLLSANFFLPSSSEEEKVRTVANTINELGLLKAHDVIIGDAKTRGVSGGERKRTSIAVQLLTNPAVLFLDEPTSGLGWFTLILYNLSKINFDFQVHKIIILLFDNTYMTMTITIR